MEAKCLIIVHSYHHNNTAKIADAFSEVLHAKVMTPETTILEDLQGYDVIGFGAGIDSGVHYKPLIEFVDKLPNVNKKVCFIFSTSAIQGAAKVKKDHSLLRQKLEVKGYTVLGEFSCKGYNTNSFLKYVGGMNKDRPNSEDLQMAKEFAIGITTMMNQNHYFDESIENNNMR
jgi:flavodoxin